MSCIVPTQVEDRSDLVTVALDIGTSFSGYAYLTRNDFKINPLRVHCVSWNVGELGTLYKTKTAILLDNAKKYVSFGYEAEKRYMEMDTNESKNYYFFKYFKMSLYGEQTVRKNMKIQDEKGKKVPAHIVFSEAIRFLRDTAIVQLTKDKMEGVLKEQDLKWVVTLPAIWSESAKQFMIFACTEAGIKRDQLDITLEPESAALCCSYMTLERTQKDDNSASLETFSNGRKLMILDLGGGTVDITVYEVVNAGEKNSLKEIFKATGGPWGGRKVDEEFELFWKDCIGSEQWDKMKNHFTGEIAEFCNRFEIQKRNFKGDIGDREKINLTLPECIREIHNLDELLKEKYGERVSLNRGKISFPADEFRKFYEESKSGIAKHLDGLFSTLQSIEINTVLLVGGFSESVLIQDAIKAVVSEKSKAHVFVPIDPGSVVLKGAAIYGYYPEVITERVNRFTYGISTRKSFDQQLHSRDSAHYQQHRNGEYIEDIFHAFVRVGETVIPGKTKATQTFSSVALNSRGSLEIEVYASSDKNPMYTRDIDSFDTFKIGCIEFPKFDKNILGKTVTVNMTFGCVHLDVDAILETGETVSCSLNLLK